MIPIITDAGLAGETDLEQARADMLIYCFDDTIKPFLSTFSESDEAKKVRTDDNVQFVKSCEKVQWSYIFQKT